MIEKNLYELEVEMIHASLNATEPIDWAQTLTTLRGLVPKFEKEIAAFQEKILEHLAALDEVDRTYQSYTGKPEEGVYCALENVKYQQMRTDRQGGGRMARWICFTHAVARLKANGKIIEGSGISYLKLP